jgi:hypothetical protein
MSCGIETYLYERIATVKTMIAAYDAAITAVLTEGKSNYQLDTGMTRILVTRLNIASITEARDRLLNELSVLDARTCGTAAYRSVPGW